MIRFLDPSMLLFGLAAVVPPIVAWLARREIAAREWAAMEILARAAGRTAFRRRCVDWLVVAMRCAMLLAVAFAAARPLFVPVESAAMDGTPRESRAVVVGEATAVVAAIESAMPALAPVRSIGEAGLDDEPLESASLVVLADGVVPNAATARRLGRFVEQGGGVAVLLGPRTTAGKAVLDLPSGQTIRLTATVEGEPEADLAGPNVRRMARLAPGQGIPGVGGLQYGPPVVVARAVPSEEPLAMRVGVGRGAVGFIAVPLAIEGWSGGGWAEAVPRASTGPADWSDLPAWPAFLPFIERTILSLTAAPGVMAGGRESGIGGRPDGRSLSGVALVLALLFVLLDPLVSRSASPWSRTR